MELIIEWKKQFMMFLSVDIDVNSDGQIVNIMTNITCGNEIHSYYENNIKKEITYYKDCVWVTELPTDSIINKEYLDEKIRRDLEDRNRSRYFRIVNELSNLYDVVKGLY